MSKASILATAQLCEDVKSFLIKKRNDTSALTPAQDFKFALEQALWELTNISDHENCGFTEEFINDFIKDLQKEIAGGIKP